MKNLGSFTFSISGITNPSLAVVTGYFTIRSYSKDSSGNYQFVENSDVTLTVTPQPGTLSAGNNITNSNVYTLVTMTPLVSVVGSTTTVNMSLTLAHPFPVDGIIQLTIPKWNPFATS